MFNGFNKISIFSRPRMQEPLGTFCIKARTTNIRMAKQEVAYMLRFKYDTIILS